MVRKAVNWTPIDYIGLWAAILFFVIGGAWTAASSALFYDQISMSVTRDKDGKFWFNSQRVPVWDNMLVEWHADIRVVGRDGAAPCFGEGLMNVSKVPGDLVRYEAREWAVPCLEQGPPTAITYVRQVLLFDFLPLRPARYTFVINPETVPVVSQEETNP